MVLVYYNLTSGLLAGDRWYVSASIKIWKSAGKKLNWIHNHVINSVPFVAARGGGGAPPHHHSIGSRRISLPGYLGCKFLMPPLPTPPLVAEWCIMRKGRNKKPTAALIQLPSSILCFCCVQHGTIPICFAWACHADFLPIIPSSPGFPFRFGLDKEVFRRLYPSLLQIFVLH